MIPVEASAFVQAPEHIREILLKSDVVPINDVFIPYWDIKDRIVLFYGSYGSGKSVFIADKWIDKAIHQKYFRGYFGRKILEDVRGTVHKTIVDRIKELHKEHLFDFSEKPNGSMHIICKANGNEMLPFGASNSTSLKSIKDPTDFFLEEMDQFTFVDFGFIYSRLRTEKAHTQLWGAFNTDRLYQSHWIRKVFFEGQYKDQSFRLKANFTDNYFINQADYLDKLKLIANGDAAKLNAIAYGEFGIVRTGGEFWKQFDESKHVRELQYNPNLPIHLTLDENVTPYVTISVWQVDGKDIRQIHEMPCQAPFNNAVKSAQRICGWMDSIGHKDVVFVYGDPSSTKRSTVDENNRSFYDKFLEVLQKREYKYVSRIGRSHPSITLSAAFINDIYENQYNGWNIAIHNTCFQSIEDYLLVKEDADGKMAKAKEKDKETGVSYEPQGHFSDAKRYFLIRLLQQDFEQYTARVKKPRAAAA